MFPQVAPRARFERATYCLGGRAASSSAAGRKADGRYIGDSAQLEAARHALDLDADCGARFQGLDSGIERSQSENEGTDREFNPSWIKGHVRAASLHRGA
jgi:hypothetical protein